MYSPPLCLRILLILLIFAHRRRRLLNLFMSPSLSGLDLIYFFRGYSGTPSVSSVPSVLWIRCMYLHVEVRVEVSWQ